MSYINQSIFEDYKKDSLIEFSEKLTKAFIKVRDEQTINYLKGRGMSEGDIDAFEWGTIPRTTMKKYPQFLQIFKEAKMLDENSNIKFAGCAVYPIRHAEGYITGWQAKNMRTGKYYTMSVHGVMPNVYGMHRIGQVKSPVGFITEGFFDYYSVTKSMPFNLPVVATLTANIRESSIKYLLRYFSRLVFLYDLNVWNTDLGKTVKKRLEQFEARFSIVDFPKALEVKDWGEVYQKFGESKTSDLLVKYVPDIRNALN